ncbi:hypothetical protein ACIP8Z_11490 [Streptomyces sp. NPDC088553]
MAATDGQRLGRRLQRVDRLLAPALGQQGRPRTLGPSGSTIAPGRGGPKA